MSSQDTDTLTATPTATSTPNATATPTTTAPADSGFSWGSLFVLEPEVILGFVVVGILLIVIIIIVIATFSRVRYSNGRLLFLPRRSTAARGRHSRSANKGGSAINRDPPVLWDVVMTMEKSPSEVDDNATSESHMKQGMSEWNIMPVSAVKTFYESNDLSQGSETATPREVSFSINPFHLLRRNKPSDAESALPPPSTPPPPKIQTDAFVDVAIVVAMPKPPEKREGETCEYCLGIERVPLAEQQH